MIGIGTTDGKCKWPKGMEHVEIGSNRYIDGPHLPQRLIDTMRLMLLLPYDHYVIIEWDCLFFSAMPQFTGMVGYHAGNKLPGMRATRFFHVPWGFDYDTGRKFLSKADELIKDASGHEASPDVFFGWVCEEAGIEVTQPWDGFSRNSLDCAGDLDLARDHRRRGVMALHGCKSEAQLAHILS